jgi:DNA-directed RNA polymerase subunit omega
MRDSYLLAATKVISDPYILVNVVSRRVKQLRRGSRPLVESLEKLSTEDIALREIAEGKISYELATAEELERTGPTTPVRLSSHAPRTVVTAKATVGA